MNNKIPLKKFAGVFSKDLNIPENEAENFIKLLFETISSELKNGNNVTISGIGTFSLSDTGSEPVKFTADDALAAEVNAPFAIFSPVPL
ncbi:MAG: HU family DNA-binding protein, partial [Paramuribaculum sp.]|nr:HU family DNA-binding protein [Paramuribaculum sp.]